MITIAIDTAAEENWLLKYFRPLYKKFFLEVSGVVFYHPLYLSRLVTKPTMRLCAKRRLRSALGIRPFWSVFAVHMKKPWFLSYPLSAQRRFWSPWRIWVFAGRTLILSVLSCRGSTFFLTLLKEDIKEDVIYLWRYSGFLFCLPLFFLLFFFVFFSFFCRQNWLSLSLRNLYTEQTLHSHLWWFRQISFSR